MRKIKNNLKKKGIWQKLKSGLILALIVLLISPLVQTADASAASTSYSAQTTIEGNSSNNAFDGKLYTSENPYKILEIVTDKGIAELGYQVGTDNTPVSFDDVKLVYNQKLEKNKGSILTMWRDAIKGINSAVTNVIFITEDGTEIADWSYQEKNKNYVIADYALQLKDGTKCYGKDRNIFARGLFGADNNMLDAMEVTVVEAKDVTVDMLNQYDPQLIYIHVIEHDQCSNIYNTMVEYKNKYPQLISDNRYTAKVNTNKTKDVTADVAMEIYLRSVTDDYKNGISSLILERAVDKAADYSDTKNLGRLMSLNYSVLPETFISEFAADYNDVSWSGKEMTLHGSKGSVYINGNTGDWTISYDCYMPSYCSNKRCTVTSYRITGTLSWSDSMFYYSPLNCPVVHNHYGNGNIYNTWSGSWYSQYPYFTEAKSKYIRGRVFFFNSDNAMDKNLLTGTTYNTDTRYAYNNEFVYQTEFSQVDNGNSSQANIDLVHYIIGDVGKHKIYTPIYVLEIQPSGAYAYNSYAGVKKILSYLNCSEKGITERNYTDYVKVKSVASNGFNGMNDDLIESYDLVIVGTNNVVDGTTYFKSNYALYTTDGYSTVVDPNHKSGWDKVNLPVPGNDLTTNAYNKLTAYAAAGKPMVISDDIANKVTSKVADNTKIAGLSALTANDNVIKESISKKLTLVNRPVIDIDGYDVKYTNAGVAIPNVDAASVESGKLVVSGKLISNLGELHTYTAAIYVDRDGDGLYEGAKDQIWTSGANKITEETGFRYTVTIPEEITTYARFKFVVTDENGNAAETESAFIFEVPEDKIKPVSILQIRPKYATNLDMTDSYFIDKLFNVNKSITGLEIVNADSVDMAALVKMCNTAKNSGKGNPLMKYTMIAIGFINAYGNWYDETGTWVDRISDPVTIQYLKEYIEADKIVLLSHDTVPVLEDRWEFGYVPPELGSTLIQYMGMKYDGKGIYQYTAPCIARIAFGGSAQYGNNTNQYNGAANMAASTKIADSRYHGSKWVSTGWNNGYYKYYTGWEYETTTSAKQLNEGQVTQFPYNIPETLDVGTTHWQYFTLGLENDTKTDDDDVVVWYTLNSDGGEYSYIYNYMGQDAVNDYYIYSKGNIVYTGSGHSGATNSERMLFVNTIVRALKAANNPPAVTVDNGELVGENAYQIDILGDETELPEIDFTPSDPDEGFDTSYEFKECKVYWVNADGEYVLLETYSVDGKNPVKNRVQTILNLQDEKYRDLVTISGENNNFVIEVSDGKDTSSTTVNVKVHELFDLD